MLGKTLGICYTTGKALITCKGNIMKEGHARANRDIYEELSQHVIGHDTAKKVLINLVNRSKLRYYTKWGLLQSGDEIKISNCLLIGESGTGKTHLIESLAKVMDFPLLRVDATELNPTGASGGLKKADFLKLMKTTVLELMEENPQKYFSYEGTMDQLVVFVDEIDKLGQVLSSDWNHHVQSNFLTLFDNKEEYAGVTFVFAGAFAKMEKRQKGIKQLGFQTTTTDVAKPGDLAQKVIAAGLLPELVGRLSHIVLLDELKKEDYKKILFDLVIPKANSQLSLYGIYNFKLSDEQLDHILETAIGSGLGVRGLETGFNQLLVDIEFDPTSYDDDDIDEELLK